MKTSDTQRTRVLDWLKKAPLTQFEAIHDLGILRLSARIEELRREGYCIPKEMIKVSNRFGEVCTVAEYRLVEVKK